MTSTTHIPRPRRMRRMLDRDARAGKRAMMAWSGLMLGVGLMIGIWMGWMV